MTISVIPVLWCLSLTHYVCHWPHGDIWHNWKWNTKRNLNHPGTRKLRHGFPGCNSMQKTRLHHLLPHECASHLLTSIHWKFGCTLSKLLLVLEHINPSLSMPHIPLTTWRDLTQLKMKFEEKPQPPWQKEIKMWFPKSNSIKKKKVASSSSTWAVKNYLLMLLVHIASCTWPYPSQFLDATHYVDNMERFDTTKTEIRRGSPTTLAQGN